MCNFLTSQGYERGKVEKTLFIRKLNSDIILVQLYVDDIIFRSINESLCQDFVSVMQEEFEMSMMGELILFLGLQVKQMKHGTFLCQSKYCKELLKKFKMDNCKEATTLISTNCYLDLDEKGVSIDQTKYRGLIGSLLYIIASWPDIMFSVYKCARFQSNLKESHFKAEKSILKYLKWTVNVGLWYPIGASSSLIGYSDSDFAGCKQDMKSTSGTCHKLISLSLFFNDLLLAVAHSFSYSLLSVDCSFYWCYCVLWNCFHICSIDCIYSWFWLSVCGYCIFVCISENMFSWSFCYFWFSLLILDCIVVWVILVNCFYYLFYYHWTVLNCVLYSVFCWSECSCQFWLCLSID